MIFVFVFHFLSFFAFVNAQPTTWIPRGIGGGGGLFAPSISPYNSNEIYIACDMSDLFHTTDSGLSWEIVHFSHIKSSPDTKIQFTSDPNILYTAHYPTWQSRPAKSTDGGKTWVTLENTDPTDGETYYLFADDGSTNRLIVTSYSKIFFSNDGGDSFSIICIILSMY